MTATPAVIVLTNPASYRGEAFIAAAKRLDLHLVQALDLPAELDHHWHVPITIDFTDIPGAVDDLIAWTRSDANPPVSAIIALDDRGAQIAAEASARLGLAHNDPQAALAARDKHLMRQRLQAGGVPVPAFHRVPANGDPRTVPAGLTYPVVVKPTLLSGSRGVIRADDDAAFQAAFARTRRILEAAGIDPVHGEILVEQFVPGFEVALEGLVTDGELQTLALFDKPDPLDGPYFEETIYVTPSRLSPEVQQRIQQRTAEAAHAIGVRHGPVHAELRIDLERGDIWLIELAGRSIGGLCASVLEFGAGMSLEELILRHAVGEHPTDTQRNAEAAGVMMIPIPEAGMFRAVNGGAEAAEVPGITGIEITAPFNQPIAPLPEGESYLGFIFARGETSAFVEQALRDAHALLSFRIVPTISLRPS